MNPVSLNIKIQGNGPPILILHGLFGSLDNWQTIANAVSNEFTIYLIDLRNHGKSPHTEDFSYILMANDIMYMIQKYQLVKPFMIGHSMGGKVVLELINLYPNDIGKSIIIDIATKSYPRGHDEIFKSMLGLDLKKINKRSEAEFELSKTILDQTVRQFILKNLDRDQNQQFVWKLNLKSLFENYNEIILEIKPSKPIINEILFIRGGRSNYILDKDQLEIKKYYPNSSFVTIAEAGHWVHADQPIRLVEIIKSYCI
ncbi:MAG: alpha/beta fold hydrolase [Saprospiraceae bacterium]|jgi:esterase|nr:alpha/beta fold hydrolase [Saprospiraceae bacterium]